LIDRRSFMQAAALVAVGDLLSPSSNVRAYASSFPASVPTQMAVGGTGTKHVFKVDGWDPREHLPVERSKTSPSYPAVGDLAGDEVFIRINQAWRTAWR
jgi:hypothetical protein